MRRRMRWRWAPDERWTKKAAKWNPGLSTKHQTNRTVGRPKKRWEDEINEETKGNDIKNYDTWIKVAKKSKKLESNGNRLCSCSSEPPLSRCRMRYATDASNLTCVLGEIEFSFTCGESAPVGGAVETACSAFGHAANAGAGKAPRGLSAQISCA